MGISFGSGERWPRGFGPSLEETSPDQTKTSVPRSHLIFSIFLDVYFDFAAIKAKLTEYRLNHQYDSHT